MNITSNNFFAERAAVESDPTLKELFEVLSELTVKELWQVYLMAKEIASE